MKNLTKTKAILFGLRLIALVIASVPYSSQIIKPAFANSNIQKVAICNLKDGSCVDGKKNKLKIYTYEDVWG